MKRLIFAVAVAVAVLAPAATAAAWAGPAPTTVAAQLVPAVNQILATPACGQYACSTPSTYRFARATCVRQNWNQLLYDCTAPLMNAGVVVGSGATKGHWLIRVSGTAARWTWRDIAPGAKCVFDDCGGVDLSPLEG